MRIPEPPRPLFPEERDALLALLNHADFEGRDELLAQADETRVVGRCGCGCATVELATEAVPSEATIARPVPNEATVIGPDGEAIGGVLLFAEHGQLSELEVYSFSEDPISPFPSLELLKLEQSPRQ